MFFLALNNHGRRLLSSVVDFRKPINTLSSGSGYIGKRDFKPILVSIEGNIGAGKTTLLEHLRKRRPDWTFINEPIDSWSKIRNDKDQSILEVFYEDRRRWAYTFQNCALLTRYQEIESTVKATQASSIGGTQIFLTERCLDTDYHVFTKMLKADGSLDSIELQLYEKLLNELKKTATPLAAIVHVNTVPEICSERIKHRGRAGEEAISMDYLKSLDFYQNAWIDKKSVPHFKTDLSDVNLVEEFISSLVPVQTEVDQSVNSTLLSFN